MICNKKKKAFDADDVVIFVIVGGLLIWGLVKKDWALVGLSSGLALFYITFSILLSKWRNQTADKKATQPRKSRSKSYTPLARAISVFWLFLGIPLALTVALFPILVLGGMLYFGVTEAEYLRPIFWISIAVSMSLGFVYERMQWGYFNEHEGIEALVWLLCFLGLPAALAFIPLLFTSEPSWISLGSGLLWFSTMASLDHHRKVIQDGGYKIFFSDLMVYISRPFRSTRTRSKSKSSANRVITDFDEPILPNYLPEGYYKQDEDEYEYQSHKVFEIIFSNDHDEHVVWLKESLGQIPDSKPLGKTETIELLVKRRKVTIHEESRDPFKQFQEDSKSRFINANWKSKRVNYNLRTDGLALSEVEKIISSIT